MRTVDTFCDIGAVEEGEPLFISHSLDMGTMIEVQGVRTIVSDDDFLENMERRFAAALTQILKRPGHSISISYESSLNFDESLQRFVIEQRENALRKGLDFEAIIEENAAVIARRARFEKVLIAVWTRRAAGVEEEVARDMKEADAEWRALPPARRAQNPFGRIGSLEGPHQAFVSRVLEALSNARIQARVIQPGEKGERYDLVEVRRALLFHETPRDWTPVGPGLRKYPGAKTTYDDDVSEFFTPTVAEQLLTETAVSSDNFRTLEMGGRRYAIGVTRLFPRTMTKFNSLLTTLLAEGGAKTAAMPFRVTLHIEAQSSVKAFQTLKKIAAGMASFASAANRNLFHALRGLEAITNADDDAVVVARLLATTWTEPDEPPNLLNTRRAYISKALQTWGDASVTDAPANPMRALAETVPGMVVGARSVAGTHAPLSDLSAILPFHRTAPIFERGQALYTTLDGKITPIEAFSAEQQFWLTAIFATPGSGKSVFLNGANVVFAAFTRGPKLPFIAVIDIGVSSEGFIRMIEATLPIERRHEAVYVRLQNKSEYAINPLDISLGSRRPLSRERTYIENFVLTLLASDDRYIVPLVTRLIDRVYQLRSDLEMGSQPNKWQRRLDPEIDAAAEAMEIKLTERTNWWTLVDEFMVAGNVPMAMRAQRYAMPRLQDFNKILSEVTMISDFNAELCKYCQRAIEGAIERYPMFASSTRLDIGPARVVSLDLQDVADRAKTPEAHRKNTLFYMSARQVFLSKISGWKEEIKDMDFPYDRETREVYQAYWAKHFGEISEMPKRLCMDEYHMTSGVDTIAAQVLSDAREGRKWGLEIVLASQFLADFEKIKNMASSVIILNGDTNELRKEAQDVLGFSDAVRSVLAEQVHGPQPGLGANFLARFKMSDEERWVLLNYSPGPRLLWALTTRQQDRAIRDALYARVSASEAWRILAERYPRGSAVDHWNREMARHSDKEGPLAEKIAEQILREYFAARPDRLGEPQKWKVMQTA